VCLLEPVDAQEEFPCHRGEAANLFVLLSCLIYDEQTSYQELFVDIDPTTTPMQYLHNLSSLSGTLQ
jgi:hypothetical protein